MNNIEKNWPIAIGALGVASLAVYFGTNFGSEKTEKQTGESTKVIKSS